MMVPEWLGKIFYAAVLALSICFMIVCLYLRSTSPRCLATSATLLIIDCGLFIALLLWINYIIWFSKED